MAHGIQSWVPRLDPVLAIARQVVQFGAGAAVMYGVMSSTDASSAVAALVKIGGDVTDILKNVAIVTSVATGAWAAYKASKIQQIKSVQAMPDVQVHTTSAEVKAAVPEVTKVKA